MYADDKTSLGQRTQKLGQQRQGGGFEAVDRRIDLIVGDAFESDFQIVFCERSQLEERLEKITHASTHVAIVFEFAAQE